MGSDISTCAGNDTYHTDSYHTNKPNEIKFIDSYVAYYKLLRPNLIHNNYVFKKGLNVLTEPFDNTRESGPGGFYISDINNIFKWLGYYEYDPNIMIAEVKLLKNSKIFDMRDRLKTDKIYIQNIQSLKEFFNSNPDIINIALKQNSYVLQYIENQSTEGFADVCFDALLKNVELIKYITTMPIELFEEMCIKLIKRNHSTAILRFINRQTPKICIEAVKQDIYNIRYVKNMNQDEFNDICLKALKINGYVIRSFRCQSILYCITAVRQNGMVLECIENQTDEICMEAVKQNGMALRFVENQTDEICINAVKQNGLALQYVKNQTNEICINAVKQNPNAFNFVKNKTAEICAEILKTNSGYLKFVVKK
jgi:hypothetical protein